MRKEAAIARRKMAALQTLEDVTLVKKASVEILNETKALVKIASRHPRAAIRKQARLNIKQILAMLLGGGVLGSGALAASSLRGGNTYDIQRGDTLSGIAKTQGSTIEELLGLNPQITDRDLIYAGDQMNLPGGSALDSLGDILGSAGDTLGGLWDSGKETAGGIWDSMTDTAQSVWSFGREEDGVDEIEDVASGGVPSEVIQDLMRGISTLSGGGLEVPGILEVPGRSRLN